MTRVRDAMDGEDRHRWAGGTAPCVWARASVASAAKARFVSYLDRTNPYGSPVAPMAIEMSTLVFIRFGSVAGSIGRTITPGKLDMGIVIAGLLGIAGSSVGDLGGSALTDTRSSPSTRQASSAARL
jgi:uncharacterized membrane protein YeaQ/YmgE (transglycosylase-associated protein family)